VSATSTDHAKHSGAYSRSLTLPMLSQPRLQVGITFCPRRIALAHTSAGDVPRGCASPLTSLGRFSVWLLVCSCSVCSLHTCLDWAGFDPRHIYHDTCVLICDATSSWSDAESPNEEA
jgi:hypothetical protein